MFGLCLDATAAEIGGLCRKSFEAYDALKSTRPRKPDDMKRLEEAGDRIRQGLQRGLSQEDLAVMCSEANVRYRQSRKLWAQEMMTLGNLAATQCAKEVRLFSEGKLEAVDESFSLQTFLRGPAADFALHNIAADSTLPAKPEPCANAGY